MCNNEDKLEARRLYEMPLHTVIYLKSKTEDYAPSEFTVMRVIGGWVYRVWDNITQEYCREFFVPFNNEYQ